MPLEKSNQFRLLLRKNLKIEIRTWYLTLWEVVIIVACILLDMFDPFDYRTCNLSLYDNSINKMNLDLLRERLYPSRNTQKINDSISGTLFFTPKSSSINDIITGTEEALGLTTSVAYKNAENMKLAFRYKPKKPVAAIEFHDVSNQSLGFTLYMLTEDKLYRNHINMYSMDYVEKMMIEPNNPININFKNTLLIQHRIYLEWLKLNDVPNELIPNVQVLVKSEDKPKISCAYFEVSHLSWLCYTLIYLMPFLNQIWRYSKELEDNVYCHQWMYGLEHGDHWFTHFIISFLHLQILNIFVILPYALLWKRYMSFLGNPYTNMWLVIVILIIYLMIHNVILLLCAMITASMFRNAKNAVIFGIAIWFASYGLHVMLINILPHFNWTIIISFILFFNNILPYGLHLLSEFHIRKLHEILFVPLFGMLYIILLIIILGSLDYWYLHNHRKSRKFHICVVPQCYRRRKKSLQSSEIPSSRITESDLLHVDHVSEEKISWNNFEVAPPNAVRVLSLKNVFTFYDNRKIYPQLRDITMDIYKGEISVIVGSDRLVKKAFIEVLAGWRQYQGTIYFNDTIELQENVNDYKHYADVCMETNPLYGLLTVKETLQYFIYIKRQGNQHIEKNNLELIKWLETLKTFGINRQKLIVNLSYSQKRLVALCCALCTDTRIILLAEPTLYMKSKEQLFYWETLQHFKPERSIIITTFSLDEAEKIGDRIGILTDGYMVAWGSLLYLKNTFASNYTLIVVREVNRPVAPITALIQSHIGYVEASIRGNILAYILPGNKKKEYRKILIELEAHTDALGIQTFRVESGDLRGVISNLSTQYEMAHLAPDLNYTLKMDGPILQKERHHVYAMLYKKAINQKFNVTPIIAFLMAAIFIIQIHIMTKHFQLIGYNSKIESFSLNEFEHGHSLGILETDLSCPYVEVKESSGSAPKKFEYYMCSSNPNNITKKVKGRETDKKNLGLMEMIKPDSFVLGVPIHKQVMLPLAVNLVENFILSRLRANRNGTIGHVYVNVEVHSGKNIDFKEVRSLCIPLTLGIIMPIISSAFIINLISELESGFVTTQKLAGLNMFVFWSTTFMWDYLIYMAIIICCFTLMLVTTFESLPIYYSLLILMLMYIYCVPAILLNYVVAQFVTADKCKAFLIVLNIHIITGLCVYTFYKDVMGSRGGVIYIFMISPLFALIKGAENVNLIASLHLVGSERAITESFLFVWRKTGILIPIMCILMMAVLFVLLLVLIIQFRKHYYLFTPRRMKKMLSGYYLFEDDDVIAEKIEISTSRSANIKHFNVVVDQVEGVIPKTGTVLNSVSFKIAKETCFCIYGTNNAGKTHLLRQLIGEEKIYYGEVYICRVNIRRHAEDGYKFIGYCPEEGGLLEVMTPNQLLRLMYLIHGVPKSLVGEYIRKLAITLNLQAYLFMQILTLPYGVKRRLNVAICLMGHRAVLILDEPTKGLSGLEAKLVTNALRYARCCGKSIIITTNDSYECEALSDIVMVVNNGAMLALGTCNQIRQKYTTGFYLEIKLRLDGETEQEIADNLEADIENVTRFVHFLQERSEFVKQQGYVLLYYLPVPTITYSQLFAALENNRTRLNIAEYLIHLGTLVDALENMLIARQNKTKHIK